MFDLKGKVALVTGGNGGIGLGMALGLASAGAQVVVAARNAQKSAEAVAQLRAAGSTSWSTTRAPRCASRSISSRSPNGTA